MFFLFTEILEQVFDSELVVTNYVMKLRGREQIIIFRLVYDSFRVALLNVLTTASVFPDKTT